MNHFVVAGRVVADPQTFKLNNGENVVKFSVAENATKDKVNYFDIACFKSTGKIVNLLEIKKGDKVTISGIIEHNKWTDKNGNKRSGYTFVAHSIDLTRTKIEGSTPIDVGVTDPNLPF